MFKLKSDPKYSDFAIFLSVFLTFSTANNKQCLLDDVDFIVQRCSNIVPKVSYFHIMFHVMFASFHQQGKKQKDMNFSYFSAWLEPRLFIRSC